MEYETNRSQLANIDDGPNGIVYIYDITMESGVYLFIEALGDESSSKQCNVCFVVSARGELLP